MNDSYYLVVNLFLLGLDFALLVEGYLFNRFYDFLDFKLSEALHQQLVILHHRSLLFLKYVRTMAQLNGPDSRT